MKQRLVYLDHNATTPLHPQVRKTILESLDVFGNPSSLHNFGRQARQKVEESREKIAAFIGAQPDEVFFVGSGSEGNNSVLSIIQCNPKSCTCPGETRHEIITSTIEHPCILEASKCLGQRGSPVRYVSVDPYGKIKFDHLKELVTEKTGLVSVMMANNEIGTIQDIKAIAALTHERGALFHTDAVQAAGKIPVNVKQLGVDMLTISGHKMYGPKGVGAVYVRKGISFCPLIRGGHQEKGRRAGTENTIGIIAFAKAVEMREKEMSSESQRLLKLKSFLKDGIRKEIPDIEFNGHPTDCLPGTLNVSFLGVEGESILLYLDLDGIAVSTGSACASGSLDPSHVLLATGMPAEKAHGSIRISLGRDNTQTDMTYTLASLKRVIAKVRGISSAYKGTKK